MEATETKHAPLPFAGGKHYHTDDCIFAVDREFILEMNKARPNWRESRDFIVKACNSFDDLVKACEAALLGVCANDLDYAAPCPGCRRRKEIEAVLAKVKQES